MSPNPETEDPGLLPSIYNINDVSLVLIYITLSLSYMVDNTG